METLVSEIGEFIRLLGEKKNWEGEHPDRLIDRAYKGLAWQYLRYGGEDRDEVEKMFMAVTTYYEMRDMMIRFTCDMRSEI